MQAESHGGGVPRPSLFRRNGSAMPILLALFLLGAAARFAACLLLSHNPFVMPDEAVYANIARSLWDGTGVTLRGQPLTYTNLLYPLLIAPAWVLPLPWGPFRTVQLINCLVMNLAVFPAYGIAHGLTGSRKRALFVAAAAILLPDMILTTRIMAEPLSYPLFLLTVQLMFRILDGRAAKPVHAVLAGGCAFLLTQAKGGYAAVAAAFAILLVVEAARGRSRSRWAGALGFALAFGLLSLLARLLIGLLPGVDYSNPSIYQTEASLPTAQHLKQTLPGLLLYLFFVPVAFGVYPLLLPATSSRLYGPPQRRQLLLTLAGLAAMAAGACYMFHAAGTTGSGFAGRVHLRYLFPFLPVLLAFSLSPALEGSRPGPALKAWLGVLLAMVITVTFSALLSNRRYPVDALLLSVVIFDDPAVDFRALSQIAAIAFTAAMLALVSERGWGKTARLLLGGALALSLVVNNWLGYDLNRWNDSAALERDAAQTAALLKGRQALLVSDSSLYFDNGLSVLDIAMADAPQFVLLEDLCENLGPYGELVPFQPPRYWTETPDRPLKPVESVALNGSAFHRVVPAAGAQTTFASGGTYGVLTLSEGRRVFHSALAGVGADGTPGGGAALYVYDEALLRQGSVRVYLQVRTGQPAQLTLSAGEVSYPFDLDQNSGWIYADFAVPPGAGRLKVSVAASGSDVKILTYRVQ